jgi:L-lactate dehydrogenase complex protein LldG
MSGRAGVLAAIRDNRPSGTHELPPAAPFAPALADPAAVFRDRLERMGGRLVASLADLHDRLSTGVVCSLVPEVTGTTAPDAADMTALARIDVVIARAVCGVAETGSVLFTEAELRVNAVAYLAQHLVVLLRPADIVADLAAAYRLPGFRTARYAVFHTGPSATADIEGVLIHGAQGVRSLTVVLG